MNAPASIKSFPIVEVDGKSGVVLPPELLESLGMKLGDLVDVVEQGGGLTIRRHQPTYEEQMAVAREVMARHRDALRELAK